MQDRGSRYREIARIGKVHGLDGTVKVHIPEESEVLFDKGTLLYLRNRRGDIIPARITGISAESKQHVRSFFVNFDRIADRSQAESFRDTPIYTDEEIPLSEEPESESFEGFEVRDQDGLVGYISGLMTNPAHTIIEVSLAEADSPKVLLVPWVDEYVLSVDENSRIIHCQNLNQLKNI